MSDIAMCLNGKCRSFEGCYRAQATTSPQQSYSVFDPGDQDRCAEYITFGCGVTIQQLATHLKKDKINAPNH